MLHEQRHIQIHTFLLAELNLFVDCGLAYDTSIPLTTNEQGNLAFASDWKP